MDSQTQLNCCHDYTPVIDPYTGIIVFQQCMNCYHTKSIHTWYMPLTMFEDPGPQQEWKIINPPGPILSTHWPFEFALAD